MARLRRILLSGALTLALVLLAAPSANAYCTDDGNCFRDCLNQVIRHKQLVCMH
jgi:hypothetical protein